MQYGWKLNSRVHCFLNYSQLMFVSILPPATWICQMSAKSKEMYILVI